MPTFPACFPACVCAWQCMKRLSSAASATGWEKSNGRKKEQRSEVQVQSAVAIAPGQGTGGRAYGNRSAFH